MATNSIDPAQIKKQSEEIVLRAGGRICDWLPHIERQKCRSRDELVGRALVLNALLNIAFNAPVPVIKNWIERNGLAARLTPEERNLLQKDNTDLSDHEITNLGSLVGADVDWQPDRGSAD